MADNYNQVVLNGNIEGTLHFGIQGPPGPQGPDGGYYVPAVEQTGENELKVSFSPSLPDMPAVDPVTVELPAGPNSGGNVDYVGVEPADDDIPKIFFGGALQQTKDEKVVPFRYISKTDDFSGYAEIKAQGNSSMSYPKKNQTVKMFADEACDSKMKKDFKGWGKQNKHVYKANWIDLSHARNVVSARLWADVVKSRANYADLPELFRTTPNQGAVDGFPVKVYADGVYQGRYTLNIPKDKWTFNMDDELEEHCVLCGENYASGCFRAAANINGNDWTDEIHDVVPDSIKTRWNDVISFVMNSTDEEFKANLSQYFFVDSLIDYYLFGLASCGLDAFGKNQIYATYDGQKWIASMYDMDSTWGLYWNGSKFVATDYARTSYEDYVSSASSGDGNLLYIRLEQLFYEELQTRWAELKNGALAIENIINRFERFTDIAPVELVKEDYASTTGGGKFTGIPSQSTNNIQQIRAFALARQAWTDEYVSALSGEGGEEEPDEPVTPETTLVSISATYSGGDVTVGTIVDDLTGIVVTATYSDGSTATVTDYTLSGEIVEGENTITATYEGLTATFTVVGITKQQLYSLPSAVTFTGTAGQEIDTGVQLFDTDKPFTVLIDWSHTTQPFSIDQAVIAHCMHEAPPYPGLIFQYGGGGIEFQVIQSSKLSVSSRNQDSIKNEDLARVKVAFIKDTSGKTTIKRCYNDSKNVLTSTANHSYTKITENLLLGCYQTTDGTHGRYTIGVLNDCKVYGYALSDAELEQWFE